TISTASAWLTEAGAPMSPHRRPSPPAETFGAPSLCWGHLPAGARFSSLRSGWGSWGADPRQVWGVRRASCSRWSCGRHGEPGAWGSCEASSLPGALESEESLGQGMGSETRSVAELGSGDLESHSLDAP